MNKFIATENEFVFPECNNCKHHIEGDKCKAFEKIPKLILSGDVKHEMIFSEQKGQYVFESEEPVDE